MKHDLKTKRDRLMTLERDWDNLHSLNSRDDRGFKSPYSATTSKESLFRRSTIITAEYGTGEKKDDYVNLDSLKSLILVQRSKLRNVEERVHEVKYEKLTLIEMLKKTREQIDADHKDQTKLQG